LVPATGGTLSGIVGSLTLSGGTGTNVLNVDDSGDTVNRSAQLSASSLTGMGLGAGIHYEGITTLSVRMGQGSDSFALSGLSPTTTSATLDGWSGYNTFSAQVAGNIAAKLNLLNFAEITSFAIGGDLSGQVLVQAISQGSPPSSQPSGQIDSMNIDGSVTLTGVIQAPAIKSLTIEGDLSGTVSETSPDIPGSLTVNGSITSTGQVSWIGPLQSLSVGSDVAGQVRNFTTINGASIGGSLTSTGSISAGNINDLAIAQILAGTVAAQGALNELTVGNSVTGHYSAGQLGKVVVNGALVHDVPAPPSPPLPPPPSPPSPSAPEPPPPATVVKVQEVLNARHKLAQILVTFSTAMNPVVADETPIYRLVMAGRKGLFTARNASGIPLRFARYNTQTNTVALAPRNPFALNKRVELTIKGHAPNGLKDIYGHFLDGAGNGKAGSNAALILTSATPTLDARTLPQMGPASAEGPGKTGNIVVTPRTSTMRGPLSLMAFAGREARRHESIHRS
jgi:hypothetical protein